MAIVLDDRDAAERPFTQVQQLVAARQLQGRQRGRLGDEERDDRDNDSRANRAADRAGGTACGEGRGDDGARSEQADGGPEPGGRREHEERDQRTGDRAGGVRGENGADRRSAFAV